MDLINDFGVLLTAAATVGAWLAARSSTRGAQALAAIETHRWHTELTPQFSITSRATSDTLAELRIEFVGPAGLDRLDELSITVRDDIRGRAPVIAGGPTAEQIAAQVWGPYRFRPGVDGADAHGRSVAPVELLLGDWRPFAMEWTLPPPWTATRGDGGEFWRQEYTGKPVRLTLTCRRAGHEPWTVPVEVTVESSTTG